MEVVVALVIVLPLLAVVAAIWLFARRLRARAETLRVERERLEAVVAGHRDMAGAHAGTAEELEPRAQAHRAAAADHTERADELEQRIEREHRHAQFHEQRASETEDERGRI
jgi:biopolymer transport protein ExbB/TolQ